MNNLPKDPVMLLSVVNTQLRDKYANPEELCRANDLELDELNARLSAIDYHYDSSTNQYK